MNLEEYVLQHTTITDAIIKEAVDMIYFRVILTNDPSQREFVDIVYKEFPNWLNKTEWSVQSIAAAVRNQEIALRIMALGAALKVWVLTTPKTLFPTNPKPQFFLEMADSGFITVSSVI